MKYSMFVKSTPMDDSGNAGTWGNDPLYIQVGGNTPKDPLWASIDTYISGVYATGGFLVENYLYQKVFGSKIKVTARADPAFFTQARTIIMGGQQSPVNVCEAFWVAIRPRSTEQSLQPKLHSWDCVKQYPTLTKKKLSWKKNRIVLSDYCSTVNATHTTKAHFDSVETIVDPAADNLEASDDYSFSLSPTAIQPFPTQIWNWDVFLKPEYNTLDGVAPQVAPGYIIFIEITYYVMSYGLKNQELAAVPAIPFDSDVAISGRTPFGTGIGGPTMEDVEVFPPAF